jgi:flagellar secretion chaperone FliS
LSGFGAKAYSKVGLETSVIAGDPHRMVMMLFDGALLSIRRGRAYLAEKRTVDKCNALGLAIEIVDCGLRASVSHEHDPEFAARLTSLYQYVIMRLLQANMRNDVRALDEADKILQDLRSAFANIGLGRNPPALPDTGGAEVATRAAQERALSAIRA